MKMENDNNSNEDRIMYLQQRKKALTLLLQEKNELLRRLCLQEADITGVIPSETPEEVPEAPPDTNYLNDANVNLTLRRKVETGFKLSENLLCGSITNEDDEVRKLLLEKQVQTSIAEAALHMANNLSNNKAVRRKHRHMYKQSQEKLAGINETLTRRISQIPKSSSLEVDLQHSTSAEENFNTSPIIRHNSHQSTSNRHSEFIPDNYYLQHADHNTSSFKDINRYTHYSHGDMRYVMQNNEPQISNIEDNIVAHNYYMNNKPNIHLPNKYRKKPRPPVDDHSVKRDQLSLSKYNIDNQQVGYVDQLQNQISDYRNTIASDSFFTYPRKDHYQNHFDEPVNHNSEFFFEQNMASKTMQIKNKPSYNVNHQSERNLFGSLDRRKINISPMANENIRANQKIKNSNRSHSIGELKMAEDVTDNISVGSHNSGNTLKEKQWHETSLDEQPISPVKQRAKTISHPYDVPINANYNDNFRSSVHGKYNYDYVDPQYLQSALPNQIDGLYEKNFVYTEPPRPSPKFIPLNVNQAQTATATAKPAMPSPTQQYYEGNGDIFPKSPKENHFNHSLPPKPINEQPTKQFLSPRTVPVESPKNIEVVSPGTWCPYKEVSKPFEMSDFYKYSTKFRNRQMDCNTNKPPMPKPQSNVSAEIKPQYSEHLESNSDPIQKGVYQPLRPLKCQPFLMKNHNIETG